MNKPSKTLTIGRIVRYRVSPADSDEMKNNSATVLPAVVVTVWSDKSCNLKVLTDGPTDAWKTSVLWGHGEGEWLWPGEETAPQATASTPPPEQASA